ncbi:MAG: replicative DNA helicase [Spirochaetes bacterium DG_61]|nr:MAG: replicative DNA helicase [Spirochaetes bacterium DG_61]
MLLDKEAIEVAIDILKGDDFYSSSHRLIFEAVLALYGQATPVDSVTITEYLKSHGEIDKVGGVLYISSLLDDVPTSANIEYYAKIVEQKSLLRKLISAASSIIAIGYDTDSDAYEIIDEAEKLIFDVTDRNLSRGYYSMNEIIKDSIIAIEKLYHRGDVYTGIPTGFKEFDDLTSGFQKSEFIIIAARPSVGKTALALNIAQHIGIRQKKNVALFSLEMSKEALVQRMLCSEARIDSQRLRKGFLETDKWAPLTTAAGKLADANIFIDETPAISDMQLRAKARRIQSRHGLDILFVDYLQLMTALRRRNEGRTQEITEISRSLKALARELNIPVVALSQLSRAVESRGKDKRPILSDLRESGAIEQDADMVVFLYRDELYNPNTPDKNVAEVIIQKQRNGPTGSLKLRFSKEYTRFDNLEKWEEAAGSYLEEE